MLPLVPRSLLPVPLEYRVQPSRAGLCPREFFTITPSMRCRLYAAPGSIPDATVAAMREDFFHYTAREIVVEQEPGQGFAGSLADKPVPRPEILHLAPDRDEAYAIYISAESVDFAAPDLAGLFWAWQTICRLAELPCFPCGTIIDAPAVRLRAVHLDLKGMMPKPEALAEMLRNFSRCKINAVLLEYEDKLAFRSHPRAAHPDLALSMSEAGNLVALAHARQIQVIPKLQCIGHLDYLLMHDEYRDLREGDGQRTYQLCPSHERSFRVWREMADELLDLHVEDSLFHIGADEVRHDYACGRCRDRDRFELYCEHLHKVADYLIGRGKRVLAWDDVFRNHDPEQTRDLFNKIVPVVWQYHSIDELLVARLRGLRLPVMGASAVSATNPLSLQFSAIDKHAANLNQWADLAMRHGLDGLIATAWTRTQGRTPSQHFLPVSYYQVLLHAETAWRGRAVELDEFSPRFVRAFFGVDAPSLGRAPFLFLPDPAQARFYIRSARHSARRNRAVLDIWDVMCLLEEVMVYARICMQADQGLLPSYRRRVPWMLRQNYLDGVRITREKIEAASAALREVLSEYMREAQIREIIETRFDAVLEENQRWGGIVESAECF